MKSVLTLNKQNIRGRCVFLFSFKTQSFAFASHWVPFLLNIRDRYRLDLLRKPLKSPFKNATFTSHFTRETPHDFPISPPQHFKTTNNLSPIPCRSREFTENFPVFVVHQPSHQRRRRISESPGGRDPQRCRLGRLHH